MTSLSSVASTPYNPSGLTTFSAASATSYDGFGVDVNNYGPRSFSGFANICAIEGAVNTPADSSVINTIGVSGYVKNASSATNAVGLYGQADSEAVNALVWGFNTRSMDNGFQTTIWGGEIDINLTNVNSVAKGLDIVGGSSVEPAVTIALRVGPLGTFSTPPKRWARGIFVDDGSSVKGIEIGTAALNSSSGAMPVQFYYNSRSNVRTMGLALNVDGDGNASFNAPNAASLAVFETGGQKQIMVGAGNGLSFFGKMPTSQKSAPTGNTSALVAQVIADLKSFGFYA